jgi:hypothetical protein
LEFTGPSGLETASRCLIPSADRSTVDRNPPQAKEDIVAIESTLPGIIPAAGVARRTASAPGMAARRWLLARCGDWLRRRNDAARLREMEPHLARDVGVAPGCDRGPEGFALDPRPLWGVGLTPRPTDVRSPWAERCRG